MKFKKFMALGLVAAMTATLFAGCGSKGSDSADGTQKADSSSSDGLVSYSDIVLGETGKDLNSHYRETSEGGLAKKYCRNKYIVNEKDRI